MRQKNRHKIGYPVFFHVPKTFGDPNFQDIIPTRMPIFQTVKTKNYRDTSPTFRENLKNVEFGHRENSVQGEKIFQYVQYAPSFQLLRPCFGAF